MTFNLMGIGLSVLFSASETDNAGPYINTGGADAAASLTLNAIYANVTVTELANAIEETTEPISLVIGGPGKVSLSGADTYSGGTTISVGTLSIGSASALGTGALTFTGPGALESTVTATLSNGIAVNSGASATFGATSGQILTLTPVSFNGGAGTTVYFGSATDTGTVVLAPSSAFSVNTNGAAAVVGGTLKLSGMGSSVIGFLEGGLTVGASATPATLDIHGFATTAHNLNGKGAGTITDSGAAAELSIYESANSTFSGVIENGTGAISLAVEGLASATLTLSGANTFTGGTTIESSRLELGANASAGAGAIAFAADAYAALILASGVDPDNAILLPDATDEIDFAGLPFAIGDHLVLLASGIVSAYELETSGGALLESLSLGGAFSDSGLIAGGDGAGGTEIAASYSAAGAAGVEASIANGSALIFITDSAANFATEQTAITTLIADGKVASVFTNNAELSDGSTTVVLTVVGGGDSVDLASGSGNSVSLYSTGSNMDVVIGSGGTVDLTNAEVKVFGGGDTIDFAGGAGNVASLYNTTANWDAVTASNGTIVLSNAQANVTGSGDAIAFAGSSGNVVGLANSSSSDAIYGFVAGDTVAFASLTFKSSYEVVWNAATSGVEIIDTAAGNAIVASLTIPGTPTGAVATLQADAGGTALGLTPESFIIAPGAVVISNIGGQAYSALEQVFTDGVYTGVDYLYTKVPAGATYSAYQTNFSAGGDFIGSQFYYTNITGQIYTAYEDDFNGGGQLTRAAYTGVSGQPFSSYEDDFVGGVLSGSQFTYTSVPQGATYSSYVVDYNYAGAFSGAQFFYTNVSGQSYTGEEVDVDGGGKLSRELLTGVSGAPYSSVELDYTAGAFDGAKYFYIGVAGQSYTAEEVDVSASNQLEKVIYSGMTSTPYSSVEYDYNGGAVSAQIFNFTDVTGQAYYADQVEQNASGANLQQTLDMNAGGHDLFALAGGQTLTSLGDDLMVGSATGATTFVLNAIYGADTIANFTAADTISLPSSEFTLVGQVQSAAKPVGGNVLITATDGDKLTIDNMTVAGLATTGTFIFHP